MSVNWAFTGNQRAEMRDSGSGQRFHGCVAAIGLGSVVMLSGCLSGGTKTKTVAKPRVAVSGTVTYEGNPLPAGKINFINTETGNSAAGVIKDGAYQIDAGNGPNPGKQGVVVLGRESESGPDEWRWSGQVEVPEDGLAEGDFAITKQTTKPAPKANPDDT